MNKDEAIWRAIANCYVTEHGAELLRERDAINAAARAQEAPQTGNVPSATHISSTTSMSGAVSAPNAADSPHPQGTSGAVSAPHPPVRVARQADRVDIKVRGYVQRRRRAKAVRLWGALAAACLAFFLLAPALLLRGVRVPAATGTSNGAVIPLSFALPEQFSVAQVQQDKGKTVYALDNTRLDPVVMTLERQADTSFWDSLTPLTLEGQRVYASANGGYCLLSFEQDGIVYQLTCQYELDTLAQLGRSILTQV